MNARLASMIVVLGLVPSASGLGALYMTDEVIDTQGAVDCGDRLTHTMVVEPPTGEEAGKAYMPRGFGGLGCPGTLARYTVEEPTSLNTVRTHLFLSCDGPVVFTGVDGETTSIRFLLQKNGEELTRHNIGDAGATCSGPADIFEFDFDMDAGGTSFASGDAIELGSSVFAFNPNDELYVLTYSAAFPSGFSGAGLPTSGGGGVAPTTIHQNVTDVKFSVDHQWVTPQQNTFLYNWTFNGTDASVQWDSEVENGSVALAVADGNGTVALEVNITGSINQTETLSGLEPGDWQVSLSYSDYVGNLSVSIEESAGGNGTTGNGTQGGAGSTDDGTDGNATDDTDGNATEDGDDAEEESPGFTFAAIGAALFAAVVVMRRRRT